ncbi:MAG: Ferric enterobactin transport ATP-binding protein FepC [Paracidovorax wautersii]|uniref:Ferric enterobactin transport ATP-binding protein FepC n=1 Tax=Paracidovorax wautersii TaxID=1177982 RepID=A0A7V8FM19_9BURK|nr:MAG: Ferric enterobactin transport ATP-binding protein FepC [Paracidovorax wautersii]
MNKAIPLNVDASTPVLTARGLGVKRAGHVVLADASARFQAGRWTAVVGPNGAGKSTLLQALAGLVPATGEVWLDGKPWDIWPARERARRLAWMGQDESAHAELRVRDVVMLGRLPHRPWFAAPSPLDEAAVDAAMARAGCLDWQARALGQLSGGERQRVLLARLLAGQAGVLLMDEPLASLDPPHQADWVALARELAASGAVVVSVLHELDAALQADDLLVVRAGRVQHHGPVADPVTRAALVAAFDGRISLISWENRWLALS